MCSYIYTTPLMQVRGLFFVFAPEEPLPPCLAAWVQHRNCFYHFYCLFVSITFSGRPLLLPISSFLDWAVREQRKCVCVCAVRPICCCASPLLGGRAPQASASLDGVCFVCALVECAHATGCCCVCVCPAPCGRPSIYPSLVVWLRVCLCLFCVSSSLAFFFWLVVVILQLQRKPTAATKKEKKIKGRASGRRAEEVVAAAGRPTSVLWAGRPPARARCGGGRQRARWALGSSVEDTLLAGGVHVEEAMLNDFIRSYFGPGKGVEEERNVPMREFVRDAASTSRTRRCSRASSSCRRTGFVWRRVGAGWALAGAEGPSHGGTASLVPRG
ncbi:retrotransposon hot spot (RHS) protein [Trypanosoma conorhini]|uniref:Retrotransposon hot spot (RHS) protein n=1 Tax=Trypanosoma conorhini TaxID=83891 RepID=A0A3R7K8S1_9TRYP|nr:retrotransposon hot spot (RHS) protein [Trypanosoma conorhini]RNE95982.1 retrotransposon hot spot (RHS) protein [Trypanosoma conorhini]